METSIWLLILGDWFRFQTWNRPFLSYFIFVQLLGLKGQTGQMFGIFSRQEVIGRTISFYPVDPDRGQN